MSRKHLLVSILCAAGFAFLVLVADAKSGGKVSGLFRKLPGLGGLLSA